MRLRELINIKNYKTLIKAIGNESPAQIISNAKQLLFKQVRKADLQYFKVEKNTNPDLQFSIDYLLLVNKEKIYVKGWMFSPFNGTKLQIRVNDELLTEITADQFRADVFAHHAHIPDARHSGFGKIVPFKKSVKKIELRLTDNSGKEVLCKGKIQEIGSLNHLLLPRHEQYKIYQDLERDYLKNRAIESFDFNPLISIVVPVYNVQTAFLDALVDSVIKQSYQNWELILHDDKSTREETIQTLKNWEKEDKRIIISLGEENQNISGATNSAIALSKGEYIGLLDHDDELSSNALEEVVRVLNENRALEIIYSDEDKIAVDGTYCEPYFKPSYNKDLLVSNNFICHFLVIKKSLGESIGWFRLGYEGAQDHDLVLRLTKASDKIQHIPKVLYHWRKSEGSTALSHDQKDYAQKAGMKAVKAHLNINKQKVKAKKGKWPGAYRAKYHVDDKALISIIIPFKDEVEVLKKCIRSIIEKTEYKNYELILVSNNSSEEQTFKYLKSICSKFDHINYYEDNIPFNYSILNNNAVKKSKADYVLLLNNDTEVINKGWLTAMAEHIQRSSVGAVGAKLLYPDGTIQHAGVILGIGGVAGHAFKGLPGDLHHYYMDGVVRNVSACTAACLMVKKEVYLKVNGLNEKDLTVAFNDIDLCLKIGKEGYSIVYTPYSELFHFESKSRGYEDTPEKIKRFEKEVDYMRRNWAHILDNDPFYNINLSLNREDYALNLEKPFDTIVDES